MIYADFLVLYLYSPHCPKETTGDSLICPPENVRHIVRQFVSGGFSASVKF